MANCSSVFGQVGIFIAAKNNSQQSTFKDKVKIIKSIQSILEDLSYPTFLQLNPDELSEIDFSLELESSLLIDFSAVGKWSFEQNIQNFIKLLTETNISIYPEEFRENLSHLQSLLKDYNLGLNFYFYELFSWSNSLNHTSISIYDLSDGNQSSTNRFNYEIINNVEFPLSQEEVETLNNFTDYVDFKNFILQHKN